MSTPSTPLSSIPRDYTPELPAYSILYTGIYSHTAVKKRYPVSTHDIGQWLNSKKYSVPTLFFLSNGHERSSAHGAPSAGKPMRHMLRSQPRAGSALLRHDGRCLESLPRAPCGLPEILNLGAASLVARATRQQPCQIRRAAANKGAPESSCDRK